MIAILSDETLYGCDERSKIGDILWNDDGIEIKIVEIVEEYYP